MPIVLDVDSLAMVWNVSQQPSIESQHPARRLDTRRGGESISVASMEAAAVL